MIQFINTGLDERIVKGLNSEHWNPKHPKVIKPIPVQTKYGTIIENRPVNADIPETVTPKIHPLLADVKFSVLAPKHNEALSKLFQTDVYLKKLAGKNKVEIKGMGTFSVEEASKLAYKVEAEEHKSLHPLVKSAPFEEYTYTFCPELSMKLGAPVVCYLSEVYGKKFIIPSTKHNYSLSDTDTLSDIAKSVVAILTPKEMSDKLKQVETSPELKDRIKQNQQYFTQPVNDILLKAVYKKNTNTYDYRLSSLFGTSVFTSLKNDKPVIIIGDNTYLAAGLSSKLDKIQYENSNEYKDKQLKTGIHPLVINATFNSGDTKPQKAISDILNMKVSSVINFGRKEFMIFNNGKHEKTVSSEELSNMIYKAIEKHNKLTSQLQKFSNTLNVHRNKELQQPFMLLNPDTVKKFGKGKQSGNAYFTGVVDLEDEYPDPDSLFSDWKDECLDYVSTPSYSRYSYQHDWKMNGYMRGKDYEYYPEMLDDIKNIEQTIDQFTLPDNIRVYRILADYDNNLDKFLNHVLSPSDSTMIQDLGFASTSVNWDSIKNWKSGYGRLKLIIDVPKGQGRGAYIAPLSQFPDEQEFLLQHGTMFKVLNIDKSNPEMYELHLQIVGCRPELPSSPPDPEAKSLKKSIRIRRAKSDNHFVADISDFKIVHLN